MDRFDFVTDVVVKAGDELCRLNVTDIWSKGGDAKNIVTNVDRESERILVEAIQTSFPGEEIYSEETPKEHVSDMWVVDPIDGSANFARGIPHFAVCMAYLENGEPSVGAVYNPITQELFSFKKGGGAYLNNQPIHVSERQSLSEALVLFRAGRRSDLAEWGGTSYASLLTHAWKVNGLGSAALDVCYVAAGRAEACVYGTYTTLDSAAALGVLKEAGGVARSPEGLDIALSADPQTGIFANGETMAGAILELLFTPRHD